MLCDCKRDERFHPDIYKIFHTFCTTRSVKYYIYRSMVYIPWTFVQATRSIPGVDGKYENKNLESMRLRVPGLNDKRRFTYRGGGPI